MQGNSLQQNKAFTLKEQSLNQINHIKAYFPQCTYACSNSHGWQQLSQYSTKFGYHFPWIHNLLDNLTMSLPFCVFFFFLGNDTP